MATMKKKSGQVHGVTIPKRQFTRWAAYYFALYVAAPVIGITLLLDLIGWLIVVKGFGASCYGILCFFN